jgi:DNA invertase Pin-like site-specific DNA recombinase
MKNEYVSLLRVSTTKQGISGLGIEAQRNSVANFITTGNGKLLAEFVEVESGKRKERPELAKAIAVCRKLKATLVIAKLDRLARNAAFVLNLKDSGVDFVAVDAPHANRLTITILAAVAEQERDWISERTKAGLAAAARRGVKLGNPNLDDTIRAKAIAVNQAQRLAFALKLAPALREIQKAGVTTLRGMAECLNARGCQTAMGKAFTRQAVAKLKRRI